ncbi:MAG TPA: ABC transporter substrate-binding protein [Geminicoccaceae bacterium]
MMKRMVWALLALVVLMAARPVPADDANLIYVVVWRGCEEACKGFKAGIAESGMDAELVIRDADQDKSRLPGFVEEARALCADLVLTWGTSVTLGIAGTLDDAGDPRFIQDIPLVFTVVADPFGTGVARGFEGSGRRTVTGTFNRVPEAVNIEVVRKYDPAFRTLGLLYNGNEPNSVLKLEELRSLAAEMNFELVALELDPGSGQEPDVETIPARMAELRAQGVEWLYLGSSSFLFENGAVFTAAAVENGIAVVSPYESLVRDHQALLSVAVRYENVGRLAAGQALRILRDGTAPGDLPIAQASEFAYTVNMEVARELDRYPPFEFLQVAETVGN